MDVGGIMGYWLDGQHARSKSHSKTTHHRAQRQPFRFSLEKPCIKRSLYTFLYLSFRWPTNCFVCVDDKRQSILAELHPERSSPLITPLQRSWLIYYTNLDAGSFGAFIQTAVIMCIYSWIPEIFVFADCGIFDPTLPASILGELLGIHIIPRARVMEHSTTAIIDMLACDFFVCISKHLAGPYDMIVFASIFIIYTFSVAHDDIHPFEFSWRYSKTGTIFINYEQGITVNMISPPNLLSRTPIPFFQPDYRGPDYLGNYDHVPDYRGPLQLDGAYDDQPHFTTADLGIERYNETVAAYTERDYAFRTGYLPTLQQPKPAKGAEEACAAWSSKSPSPQPFSARSTDFIGFSETTDQKDADAIAKGDLHGGQLHRMNRAALLPPPAAARPRSATAGPASACPAPARPAPVRAVPVPPPPAHLAPSRAPAAARAPISWNRSMLVTPETFLKGPGVKQGGLGGSKWAST